MSPLSGCPGWDLVARCLVIAAIAGFSSFPIIAAAHDVWILPGKFLLQPGEQIRIYINNGDDFPDSKTLLGAHRVSELRFIHADGRTSISAFGVDGRSLTFSVLGPSRGDSVIALSVEPRMVRIPAEDFVDYLREEGEDEFAERFADPDLKPLAATERYSKFGKSLVQGAASSQGTEHSDESAEPAKQAEPAQSIWLEPVGHRLEIVPTVGPERFTVDSRIAFRLLRDGHPAANVRLTGGRAGGIALELGRSDGEGRADILFPEAGRWFVRAFHLEPPPEDRVPDEPSESSSAWDSLWTTLTFEIQSGSAPVSQSSGGHSEEAPLSLTGRERAVRFGNGLEDRIGRD